MRSGREDGVDFYRAHSRFSDPGAQADWLDRMTGTDLVALRAASAEMVFHYRAHGDITGHGFARERMAEVNLRYADTMLARLRELDPAVPGTARARTDRLVGCCRDFTLLFVAMARHHGIPARARVGFARYLVPGWAMDHVIAEVWDGARWRLVEPEMSPGHLDEGAELALLDVPRDRFLVAADAWRACRSGAADPATFVVAPELDAPLLRGWPYLLHNLVLDLAALNKQEMVLWDTWGVMAGDVRVDEATAARMDEVAAVLADPAACVDELAAAYAADDLRVPPVVTSMVEPGGPLVRVALR
jgi:hypothetical protein